MSREDLMRISRALALFRPSVLASMMNLTEDDLIFTEKSLQRTLLVSFTSLLVRLLSVYAKHILTENFDRNMRN
jgi:hypothetical protein